ncbi:DNA-binding protein [Nocardia sp. 852002-51101_SCH5132738]|nr:SUMF1/EgtB/PvdO family nonheme iron enzyme [Nocardia nova]OBA44147.1 DNA-binding protein [Nocardia sp. 852002-51101_SCH5132738]OBB49492.1 DNA-binding protein [Nocardia sp. 852002-51244_SCH5132740]OBF64938.1 DNA-binding protein [Mycobacterium sp. 852002-51759_SCH5129042]
MSLNEFAAHLGVTERQVSYWEAKRAAITPRPANQAALDTSLSRLKPDELTRFLAQVPADAIGDSPDTDQLIQPDRIRHPVDGRSMTWIPEGVYLSGPMDQPVWLAGFHIDTYPVTNADYAVFVTATGHTAPRHWGNGRPPADLADHPVVWVTHDDATAYARWAHKLLPTAQQWEKAARGTSGATWPWGNQVTPAKCNCKVFDQPGATTPVDCFKSSVSPYGVFDLCGNVWEWLSTESSPGRFELKGSSFSSLLEAARPAAFNDANHLMCDDDTGFRCAAIGLKS